MLLTRLSSKMSLYVAALYFYISIVFCGRKQLYIQYFCVCDISVAKYFLHFVGNGWMKLQHCYSVFRNVNFICSLSQM